ncbi:hypothetical protein BV898_09914 [Hypsibius exemplaris]|uniref:Uncharacterized protein n=1 Tax=Hypsibius exemplaris TaxID=2072580 RepID=A0A1W0WLB6_HYPEX|nr:hypothetical protein BV898_09914 [Hypsibius exemplaris]
MPPNPDYFAQEAWDWVCREDTREDFYILFRSAFLNAQRDQRTSSAIRQHLEYLNSRQQRRLQQQEARQHRYNRYEWRREMRQEQLRINRQLAEEEQVHRLQEQKRHLREGKIATLEEIQRQKATPLPGISFFF